MQLFANLCANRRFQRFARAFIGVFSTVGLLKLYRATLLLHHFFPEQVLICQLVNENSARRALAIFGHHRTFTAGRAGFQAIVAASRGGLHTEQGCDFYIQTGFGETHFFFFSPLQRDCRAYFCVGRAAQDFDQALNPVGRQTSLCTGQVLNRLQLATSGHADHHVKQRHYRVGGFAVFDFELHEGPLIT